MRFPAATFNSFVDAAIAEQNRNRSGGAGSGVIPLQGSALKCYVKNDSGGDVARFGVLGIDGVLFYDNDAEFLNQVVLNGIAPGDGSASSSDDHRGKFVITDEPIKAGKIGRAFVMGVCPVVLTVVDALHKFADVKDNDTTQLQTAESGSCQIIWNGASSAYALVRIGISGSTSPSGTSNQFFARVDSKVQDGDNKRWTYSIVEVSESGEGFDTWVDVEDGRTGNCYNIIEANNGSSGLYGNGVNSANLIGTFDIQPIPDGTIIWIVGSETVFVDEVPVVQYYTQYENGIDGTCES